MAWIFELAIECGQLQSTAQRLKAHFDGFGFRLPNGTEGVVRVAPNSMAQDEEGNWWISALPVFGDGRAVQHSEDTTTLNECADVLYGRLRGVAGYRFGLVGVETTQFNTLGGLAGLIDHPDLRGLVVSDEIYTRLGQPKLFEQFAPGYLWRPYVQPHGN